MTLQVCILGIDGSGKSTITAALPNILSAEMGVLAGSAADQFRIVGPDQDHLAPEFYPDGLPLSAHLAMRSRRIAKRLVDNRSLYPIFKLAQMIFQGSAINRLGQRYGADIICSDGNTLMSATGRAANYLRPASGGKQESRPAPDAEDLKAVFAYILDNQPLPEKSQGKLPRLGRARLIYKLTRLLGLRAAWLPDLVIFLDLSPEIAVSRIASRRQKIDRHENVADLAQAREMYLKTLEAFKQYRTPEVAHCINIDRMAPGEVLRAVVDILLPHILAQQSEVTITRAPLGTTRLNSSAIQKKALNYRYFVRYLLAKWFSGSWREPTFFFSRLGRLFLKEGYSANVMRVIYDRDEKQYGMMDRIFLEYLLHRAVYDRLQILSRKIEVELEARLSSGQCVSIFPAPSGFAYDLFRPLESIASRMPEAMKRVRLLAADLDPHNSLSDELTERAERLGIQFKFLRGDITDDEMRRKFQEMAPYDMALFVGLSSWLPKPQTMRHLQWLRENLRKDGCLVTDSFTPDAYALSGRYVGYKAHYYTPEVYRALVDYCGFDGLGAAVESGRDAINHVLIASLRARKDNQADSQQKETRCSDDSIEQDMDDFFNNLVLDCIKSEEPSDSITSSKDNAEGRSEDRETKEEPIIDLV